MEPKAMSMARLTLFARAAVDPSARVEERRDKGARSYVVHTPDGGDVFRGPTLMKLYALLRGALQSQRGAPTTCHGQVLHTLSSGSATLRKATL